MSSGSAEGSTAADAVSPPRAICESCMENAACRLCNKSFTSKHDANVIVVTFVLASRRRRFALGELWATLRFEVGLSHPQDTEFVA